MNADDGCDPLAVGDRRDHRPDLGAVEPVEAHLLDRVAALEAQHELPAGLPTGQVVGPVRGDDHEVRPRLLGDAIDQVGAGRVDPVEVLDDEDGRALGDGLGHEVAHRGGEVVAGERGVDEPGDGVQRASHRARLGDDADRRDASRQRVDELAHEAGLADAGLARDERHGRLLGRHHLGGVDDPGEAGERSGPTDHDRAHPDAAAEHGLDARGHQQPRRVWDPPPDRSVRSLGDSLGSHRPSAPDRCGGREPGGRTVRRHAGRDRWWRAPPGEVGGGRGWSMGSRRSACMSRCRRKKARMPVGRTASSSWAWRRRPVSSATRSWAIWMFISGCMPTMMRA